jgi:hypothetical protein
VVSALDDALDDNVEVEVDDSLDEDEVLTDEDLEGFSVED